MTQRICERTEQKRQLAPNKAAKLMRPPNRYLAHLYQNGGHGFGLGNPPKTSTGWFPQFMLWLESNGMLKSN
jgi:hypothetical protein